MNIKTTAEQTSSSPRPTHSARYVSVPVFHEISYRFEDGLVVDFTVVLGCVVGTTRVATQPASHQEELSSKNDEGTETERLLLL